MGRSGCRLNKRTRLVIIVVVALALLSGGALYALGYFDDFFYEAGVTGTPPAPDKSFSGRINILALGVDARKGEKTARADTIMLCSVDTEKKLMTVVSIPRDTRVDIPGHGYDKINSTTLYGGPELAMQTVSDLLGIPVNNYVITSFEGFKDIVDVLGGVTIDVKQRMYHYDPQDGGIYTIDLKPGVQRLDGEKALQYVRYRSLPQGDIDRTEQQQNFLSALAHEVLQPSSVIKLPSLVLSVNRAVETNLTLPEMTRLASAAAKMTNANMVSQTLPGKFLNLDGISYWEVDPDQAHLFIAEIMAGHTWDKVVLGETNIDTRNKNQSGDQEGNDGEGLVQPQAGQDNSNKDTGDSAQGSPGASGVKKQGAAGTNGSKAGTPSGQPEPIVKITQNPKATTPPGSMIVPGVPQQNTQESNQ